MIGSDGRETAVSLDLAHACGHYHHVRITIHKIMRRKDQLPVGKLEGDAQRQIDLTGLVESEATIRPHIFDGDTLRHQYTTDLQILLGKRKPHTNGSLHYIYKQITSE